MGQVTVWVGGRGGSVWELTSCGWGLVQITDENNVMTQGNRLPGSGDRQPTLGAEWYVLDSITGENIVQTTEHIRTSGRDDNYIF